MYWHYCIPFCLPNLNRLVFVERMNREVQFYAFLCPCWPRRAIKPKPNKTPNFVPTTLFVYSNLSSFDRPSLLEKLFDFADPLSTPPLYNNIISALLLGSLLFVGRWISEMLQQRLGFENDNKVSTSCLFVGRLRSHYKIDGIFGECK